MSRHEDITCGHESITGSHDIIKDSYESLNLVFNRWSLRIIVCYDNIMEVTRFDRYITKTHDGYKNSRLSL